MVQDFRTKNFLPKKDYFLKWHLIKLIRIKHVKNKIKKFGL